MQLQNNLIDLYVNQYVAQNTKTPNFEYRNENILYKPLGYYKYMENLGKQISWRMRLYNGLSVDDKHLCFALPIRRQIEGELATYENFLSNMLDQRFDDDITKNEFYNRVLNMTFAINVLAFARGSNTTLPLDVDNQLQQAINTGGNVDVFDWQLLYELFPDNVALALRDELEPALIEPTQNLANASGQMIIGSRIRTVALWATTVLKNYSFGQLYLPDDVKLLWVTAQGKDNCVDCTRLHNQVHTVAEWRQWYESTGMKPQSRNLACKGWECGCIQVQTDLPVNGVLSL